MSGDTRMRPHFSITNLAHRAVSQFWIAVDTLRNQQRSLKTFVPVCWLLGIGRPISLFKTPGSFKFILEMSCLCQLGSLGHTVHLRPCGSMLGSLLQRSQVDAFTED